MNTEFENNKWYIGWKTENFCEVSRLGNSNKYIKVLTGRKGDKTCFFGLNENGHQVKLNIISDGILGDMKFTKVPLY